MSNHLNHYYWRFGRKELDEIRDEVSYEMDMVMSWDPRTRVDSQNSKFQVQVSYPIPSVPKSKESEKVNLLFMDL